MITGKNMIISASLWLISPAAMGLLFLIDKPCPKGESLNLKGG
jgi:hypothetical protein